MLMDASQRSETKQMKLVKECACVGMAGVNGVRIQNKPLHSGKKTSVLRTKAS